MNTTGPLIGGGRRRSYATTQWAPTLTSHDPDPPLPLEDAPLVDLSQYYVQASAPLRRAFATAVYLTALSFVPLVGAAPTPENATARGEQGGAPPPGRDWRQYQALAAPVMVPTVVTVPEGWTPVYPDTLPARTRVLSGGVAPVNQPDVAALRGWAATYPDRVARRGRAREGASVSRIDVVVVAVPTQWAPIYPSRLVRRVRAASGTVLVEPILPIPPPPFGPAWAAGSNKAAGLNIQQI